MAWKDYENTSTPRNQTTVTGKGKTSCCGGLCCGWRHHYRSLCLGELGVTQVSASFLRSEPRAGEGGGRPYQLHWCSGGSQAAVPSEPRAGGGGGPSPGWPLPIICVGRAVFTYHTIGNYFCRSRRTQVHTQLPIVYVGGSLRGPI